jgi:hypothetical protein
MITKLIMGNSRTAGGSLRDALNYPATVSYKGVKVSNAPIKINVETVVNGDPCYMVHIVIPDTMRAFTAACQREAKKYGKNIETTETLIASNGALIDVYVPLNDFRAICGVASSLNTREFSKTRAIIDGINPTTFNRARGLAQSVKYKIDFFVPTILKVPTGYIKMYLTINGKSNERITIKMEKEDLQELMWLTEGFKN